MSGPPPPPPIYLGVFPKCYGALFIFDPDPPPPLPHQKSWIRPSLYLSPYRKDDVCVCSALAGMKCISRRISILINRVRQPTSGFSEIPQIYIQHHKFWQSCQITKIFFKFCIIYLSMFFFFNCSYCYYGFVCVWCLNRYKIVQIS